MRRGTFVTLLGLWAASLFPSAARATGCNGEFCFDSDLAFDGYEVTGYTYFTDWDDPNTYLYVEATLFDLDSSSLDYGDNYGYSEVEVYLDGSANKLGTYTLLGEGYYFDDYRGNWYLGDEDAATRYVSLIGPSGEDSTAYGTFTVGGEFYATIYPSSSNYYGKTVREDAWLSDLCWFGGSQYDPLDGNFSSSWSVNSDNTYGLDDIGIWGSGAAAIVSYYQGQVGSCSLAGQQTMSMDGFGNYDSHGIGLSIYTTGVDAYRSGAQITVW